MQIATHPPLLIVQMKKKLNRGTSCLEVVRFRDHTCGFNIRAIDIGK